MAAMNLLITGANGFIGRNLRAQLQYTDHRLFLLDVDSTTEEFQKAASQAEFVFHFAGINRPTDDAEFQTGNADYTQILLDALEKGHKPPVLISSSTQAALHNAYGASKLQAEEAVRRYHARTGAPVYIYRLTNVFGKWSRPNYNSVVATFCHHIARGLPISISDPSYVLRLLYIDDAIAAFLRALDGRETPNADGFCTAGPEHAVTLERLATLIRCFHDVRTTLDLPDQDDPLIRKLFATYQSFLPPDHLSYTPVSHTDERGSFTELMHMQSYGQISVNVTKPGICKGSHWHQSKHEKFIVVAGRGVIRFRSPFEKDIYSYEVSGESLTVIDVPPGYIHTIENIGSDDLVTLMWANEVFNPEQPDTWHLSFENEPHGDVSI